MSRSAHTVWQVPRNPKGILFLAHGYQKDTFYFFDRSPSCELCYGLPVPEDRIKHRVGSSSTRLRIDLREEREPKLRLRITRLVTGFILENVINIINDIRREHSLDSGCVSSVDLDDPTVNIFPNGITSRDAVELSMATLSERGVSVGAKLCLPQPIRPLYFTERLPCRSDEDSAKMQKAYKSARWLDDADYLIEEPALSDYLAPLPKSSRPSWYAPGPDCERDGLCQELMSTWAFHVTAGDANEEMFDWLNANLSDDDDQLLLYDSGDRSGRYVP